ncbi:uncharacterized protein OCT59_002879 [Rhizophagus irregularis]|uniref:uncharacterized protein n=1 Tax=Rhizophagus irregularis TaxID=588596 RepID=UPI003316A4D5|nr:hypothetical protein OCT59_002879 [Rhizophagus irregularis]
MAQFQLKIEYKYVTLSIMGLYTYRVMTSAPPDEKPPQKWTSDEVICFLESKVNDYNFDQNDIEKIRKENVNGKAFLRWTIEILMNVFGIKYKSANSIMDLVDEVRLSGSFKSFSISTTDEHASTLLFDSPSPRGRSTIDKHPLPSSGDELKQTIEWEIIKKGDWLCIIKNYGSTFVDREIEVTDIIDGKLTVAIVIDDEKKGKSGIITLKKLEEWILNEIPEKEKITKPKSNHASENIIVKRDGKYLGPVSVLKAMYKLNNNLLRRHLFLSDASHFRKVPKCIFHILYPFGMLTICLVTPPANYYCFQLLFSRLLFRNK